MKRKRIDPKPGLDAYDAARDLAGQMVEAGCRMVGLMVIDEHGYLHCVACSDDGPDMQTEAQAFVDAVDRLAQDANATGRANYNPDHVIVRDDASGDAS